jgi:hypothetical protein
MRGKGEAMTTTSLSHVNWTSEGGSMLLRFTLNGSVLYETRADCVPPVGAVVRFRTDSYRRAFPPGL